MASSFHISLLLLFLSPCLAQTSFRPRRLLPPIQKDTSTLQYITQLNQRTPLVPVNLTLDLGGQFLWVDCDQRYSSTTYRPSRCGYFATRPGCNNNTCGLFPYNRVISTSTGGDLGSDIVSIQSTNGKNPGRVVSIPQLLFVCGSTSLLEVPRVAAVAPFGLCFNSKNIGSTRVGPAVPSVDLVLQSESVYWRIFGSNSMVQVSDNVLCLGFVDGGLEPRTSIVIGGYQIEDNLLQFDLGASRLGFSSSLLFRQTTCANFNFTSNA